MALLRRTMLIPFVLAFSTAGCAKPVPVASLPADTVQTPMGAENQAQMTSEATQTVQGPPEWFTNPASDAGVSAPGCVGLGCDPRGDVAVAIGLANALADLQARAKLESTVCGVEIARSVPEDLGPASMEFITRTGMPEKDCEATGTPESSTIFMSLPGVQGHVFAIAQSIERRVHECSDVGSTPSSQRTARLYENGASAREVLKRVRERCTVDLERRPEGRYLRVVHGTGSR